MQGSVPQNAHHTTAWYSYVNCLTNFPPFGEIRSDRSCGCWLLPIHGCFRCQSVVAMLTSTLSRGYCIDCRISILTTPTNWLLPARASEQGNVIGLVSVYIYIYKLGYVKRGSTAFKVLKDGCGVPSAARALLGPEGLLMR